MFEFAVFYKKKNRLVITVKVTYTAELTSWVKPSSSAKYHYPCRCWNHYRYVCVRDSVAFVTKYIRVFASYLCSSEEGSVHK